MVKIKLLGGHLQVGPRQKYKIQRCVKLGVFLYRGDPLQRNRFAKGSTFVNLGNDLSFIFVWIVWVDYWSQDCKVEVLRAGLD